MPRLPSLAILLCLWFPTAGATFQTTPEAACAFLSEVGLNERNYRHVGGGVYRCASSRRRLPLGGAQVHTVRYRAQGDPHNVRQLKLTLYVNSRRQVQAARRRMLEYGQRLVKKALAVSMPGGAAGSLLNGATGTWKVAGADVILEKSQIRSSSHQYHLIIR